MLAAATAPSFDPFTPRTLRIALKYPQTWRQPARTAGASAQRAENWLKRRGVLSCPEIRSNLQAIRASELAPRLFPSATGSRVEIIAQSLLLWSVQTQKPEVDLSVCWNDVIADSAELMPESWLGRFCAARCDRPELLLLILAELLCASPLSEEVLADPDYSALLNAGADCLAASQNLCSDAIRGTTAGTLRWNEYLHNSQVRMVRRIALRLQDRHRNNKRIGQWLSGIFQVLAGYAEWSADVARSKGAANIDIAVTLI